MNVFFIRELHHPPRVSGGHLDRRRAPLADSLVSLDRSTRVVALSVEAVAREIGDGITLGLALTGLALLARFDGDTQKSVDLFKQALVIGTDLGWSWRLIPRALAGLAGVARLVGDYARSARLFGSAEGLLEASGQREPPQWRAAWDADVANVRAALGDASFGAAWADGRAMKVDQAVTFALSPTGRGGERELALRGR